MQSKTDHSSAVHLASHGVWKWIYNGINKVWNDGLMEVQNRRVVGQHNTPPGHCTSYIICPDVDACK